MVGKSELSADLLLPVVFIKTHTEIFDVNEKVARVL
jgi:hypothetical protein